MEATAEAIKAQPQRPDHATRFQAKHDQVALRLAYQSYKANGGGTDTDFAAIQQVPIATFREYLKEWRQANQLPGLTKEGQAQQTSEEGDLQLLDAESSLRKKARRTYELLLDGKPVSPGRAKAASDILRGEFKDEAKLDRASEFTTWPEQALVELLADLAPRMISGAAVNVTSPAEVAASSLAPLDHSTSEPERAQAHEQPAQAVGTATESAALDAPSSQLDGSDDHQEEGRIF